MIGCCCIHKFGLNIVFSICTFIKKLPFHFPIPLAYPHICRFLNSSYVLVQHAILFFQHLVFLLQLKIVLAYNRRIPWSSWYRCWCAACLFLCGWSGGWFGAGLGFWAESRCKGFVFLSWCDDGFGFLSPDHQISPACFLHNFHPGCCPIARISFHRTQKI